MLAERASSMFARSCKRGIKPRFHPTQGKNRRSSYPCVLVIASLASRKYTRALRCDSCVRWRRGFTWSVVSATSDVIRLG